MLTLRSCRGRAEVCGLLARRRTEKRLQRPRPFWGARGAGGELPRREESLALRRFRDTDNLCFVPGSSDQNAAFQLGSSLLRARRPRGPWRGALMRQTSQAGTARPRQRGRGGRGARGSPAAVPMVTEDAGVAARGAAFGTSRSNGQGKRRGGETHRAQAMRRLELTTREPATPRGAGREEAQTLPGKSDAPQLGCSPRPSGSKRDGRVRPSCGALLLLRRMGTARRKARLRGGFMQRTHKSRARTRGAEAFAFRPCPSSETSPRSPRPLSTDTNGRRAGDGSGHPDTVSLGASQ